MSRRLLYGLLSLSALGAGCGDEGGTFDKGDFGVTFSYPAGFKEAKRVTSGKTSDTRARATEGIGLDDKNLIVLRRYDRRETVERKDLGKAKFEFDEVVSQVAGDGAPEGRQTEAAGLPALRYDGIPVREAGAESRFLFVFDDKTEYFLSCQFTPQKRAELLKGCDEAIRTLAKK